MTSLAYTNGFDEINTFTKSISSVLPKKSITNIQKVIILTTDVDSVNASKELLKVTKGIKEGFYKKDISVLGLSIIKEISEDAKNNLTAINTFWENINTQFNSPGAEVEIDDNNMKLFLSTMESIKSELEYITEYLLLVMQCSKSKNEIIEGRAKEYTIETLREAIENAA